jgi:alpha-beta hydrolase superfamily lysophospholipase
MIRKLHGATAAALLLACAGCGPGGDRPAEFESPQAAGSASVTPGFSEAGFIAADGTLLPLRRWLPEGAPRAVILALHGFNDYSHAFADAGAAWAKAGIATYAYDQRGFGAAPQRGRWAGRARLAVDAATASAVLRARYPGRPLYLLGDSMGGAVAIVATTGESGTPVPDVDGVILVAPAVWSRATMGLLPRLALFVGSRLLPAMTLSGRGLGIRASDNEPMLRALGRDPLFIKETRIDTVYGLADLMDAAFAAAPKLDRKLLLLYGEHDEIIPKAAVRRFAGALPAAPRAPRHLAWYRNGWHMLLRDLEGPWVWADVASWIDDPGAALPSAADRGAAAAYGIAPEGLAARVR